MQQFARFVEIENSFAENTKRVWKTRPISELIKLTQDDIDRSHGKDVIYYTVSRFEIIGRDCIPYFDIEKIPEDKDDNYITTIVNSLMSKLSEYGKKTFTKYHITVNTSSITHEGKSYHVFFPEFSTLREEMKKFVNYYVDMKYEGYEYIDTSVYSKDRLFRLPYQKGVNKYPDCNQIEDRMKDFHRITDGEMKADEYIISNTRGKDRIFFITIPRKYSSMRTLNQISGPYTRTNQAFNKVCNLLVDALDTRNSEHQMLSKDEECYSKCIALRELISGVEPQNKRYSELINEIISYKDEHGSFDDFRLNIRSIEVILDIIQAKI